MSKNNEVIIVGGNHHNMLGVIRAFGEKKILSNIIIINNNRYCFIKKSKYVKNCDIIKENEKDIINLLNTKYTKINPKPVLIPTSDFAALIIDKNKSLLSKNFIIPGMSNNNFSVVNLMNKYNQYKLVKEYGINIAKSWLLDLSVKNVIPDDMIYPCIIKPVVSAFATKGDITICNNKNDLLIAIEYYQKANYKEAIVQEYINFDKEFGLIGCIHKDKIILPGVIVKERIYPQRRGNVSFGIIKRINEFNINFKKIFDLLKVIEYSGMFDIEIFIKGNEFYLNEINFRNSGNSYLYTYEGVYIVYLWYLMAINKEISLEKTEVNYEFYFTDEVLELKQLISKNINFKEWNKARKESKISFLFNKNDKKPLLYKSLYAVLRRINNDK